jgi:alpha-glucosidase
MTQPARARGIRTIIDVVPNHVSHRNPWFREALAAELGSDARKQFWFQPGVGEGGDDLPTHWKNKWPVRIRAVPHGARAQMGALLR